LHAKCEVATFKWAGPPCNEAHARTHREPAPFYGAHVSSKTEAAASKRADDRSDSEVKSSNGAHDCSNLELARPNGSHDRSNRSRVVQPGTGPLQPRSRVVQRRTRPVKQPSRLLLRGRRLLIRRRPLVSIVGVAMTGAGIYLIKSARKYPRFGRSETRRVRSKTVQKPTVLTTKITNRREGHEFPL
jgi:hypothetical protein